MAKKKVRKLKKEVKVLFGVCILILGLSVYFFTSNFSFSKYKEDKRVVKKEGKLKYPQEYSFDLFMVGDALIHSSVYEDAHLDSGEYDFKPMLQYIKPISSQYDLAYYNQETILGGEDLGYSNYPCFNSPDAVGDAFIDAGFNLVSLATNHTMDQGERGVLHSVDYWSSKKNIVWDGQRNSWDERNKERIYEKNGIKYAFFRILRGLMD